MDSKSLLRGAATLLALLLVLVMGALGYDLTSIWPADEPVSTPLPLVTSTPSPRPTPTSIPPWYEIYFTNPTCPAEADRTGGVDEIIAGDILAAERGIDIASFELNSTPIVDALIALEKRGLPVRVVTDSDYGSDSGINRLRRNGIGVVEDGRSAFMHDKFIIIDDLYLWTGSMNFMPNDVYCNNNNTVRIISAELAANYRAEMDEMVNERAFGPRSPLNTPNSRLTIQGIPVENYFAPEEKVAPIIAARIESAQQEILFMAFSFTLEDIGEAMLDRAAAGINVRGVFETVGSESSFSYYGDMRNAGLSTISVRQDGNPRIMHHKVIIIDRRITIFGSYNFTASANESNDENILIVTDPQFASYFIEEFNHVWDEAKP